MIRKRVLKRELKKALITCIPIVGIPIAAKMGIVDTIDDFKCINEQFKKIKKEKEDEIYNRGKEKGKEEGKAENLSKINALNEKVENATKIFEEYKDLENYLLACYAVGISVAYCDGDITENEKRNLGEFLQGISFESSPDTFKKVIQDLYDNPPTFNEAITFVKKVNKSDWNVFSDIIEIIIASDNVENNEERAYREAWKEFISA